MECKNREIIGPHKYTQCAFDVTLNIKDWTFWVNGGQFLVNDECFSVPGKTFNLRYGRTAIAIALPRDTSQKPFLTDDSIYDSNYYDFYYHIVTEVEYLYPEPKPGEPVHNISEKDFLILNRYVVPHFVFRSRFPKL